MSSTKVIHNVPLTALRLTSTFRCNSTNDSSSQKMTEDFKNELTRVVNSSSKFNFNRDKNLLTYPLLMKVVTRNSTVSVDVGTW